VFVATAIGLAGIVVEGAKKLADRPRPTTALVTETSTSFPSGHAFFAMTAVLVVLMISAGVFKRRVRIMTIAVGALIVIAVGAARVVLNVHTPSDVVAGWALAYLWCLGCLFVFRPGPLAAEPESVPIGEVPDRTPEAPGTAR
jgi:undecaprenyl-diphosphatase